MERTASYISANLVKCLREPIVSDAFVSGGILDGQLVERLIRERGIAADRIAEFEFEVMVLRMYGNKDCTAMADKQIDKKRRGEKCDFED